jgi:hypothetical protein
MATFLIAFVVGLGAATWYVYFRRHWLVQLARAHGPIMFLPGALMQFVVFGGIAWLIAYLIGI